VSFGISLKDLAIGLEGAASLTYLSLTAFEEVASACYGPLGQT
jgi:hypothetical protein